MYSIDDYCTLAVSNLNRDLLGEAFPKDRLVRLCKDIPIQKQGITNRCGGYAISMALSHWLPEQFGPGKIDGIDVTIAIHPKIPSFIPIWLGGESASDMGISNYLQQQGFNSGWKKAESLNDVKRYIHAGIPCIVLQSVDAKLLRPHYRVVIGFDEREKTIYFNDSTDRYPCKEHCKAGNNKRTYEDFQKEWNKGGFYMRTNSFIPILPQNLMQD